MAKDDWRLRVELNEGHESLLERLGVVDNDADDLAEELRDSRLSVTHDEDTVFVYGAASLEMEKAKAIVQRELGELRIEPRELVTEHWLADEDRWDSEPKGPDADEETLAEGYAPWEVRIRTRDHRAARELADQLESEGYGIVRRWDTVIAGCASREDAQALATRLHGDVEPGGELVWEALKGHPFTVFSPL
jgi:hypothetical protein